MRMQSRVFSFDHPRAQSSFLLCTDICKAHIFWGNRLSFPLREHVRPRLGQLCRNIQHLCALCLGLEVHHLALVEALGQFLRCQVTVWYSFCEMLQLLLGALCEACSVHSCCRPV